MTTRWEYTPQLGERDFLDYDDSGLMLIRIKREIEARLRWLDEHLAPNQTRDLRSTPGQIIFDRGIIDKNAFAAYKEFLKVADPSSHSGTIERGEAAVVVETGLRLAKNLDTLIDATNQKLTSLSSRAMLGYRFLELPTSRKWDIARRLELVGESDVGLSRTELSRVVFERATQRVMLEQLWSNVASEFEDLAHMANPFEGR